MKSTPSESKAAISAAGGEQIGAVICSDSLISYAVDHNTEFCSATKDGHVCQIFGH